MLDNDPRTDLENDLAVVGLTAADEAVYRALLAAGQVTAGELEEQADRDHGLDHGEVRTAVSRLEDLGLATRLSGRPVRLRAARPDVAVNVLVSRRQEELARAQLSARELLSLMPVEERHRPEDIVEVLVGRPAIGARFEQMLSSTRDELLVIDRPPYAANQSSADSAVRQLLAAGVAVRGLYAPEALELPGALAEVQDAARAGESSRVHPGLPMKLAISDRRLAILPVGAEAVDAALCISPSTLLDALGQLFDLLWAEATPIVAPEGDRYEDRELATLLATGAKDDVVARRLGTSPRTLSRRIAQLLDDLHVQTRFQAGVQAVRYGWLPATDPPDHDRLDDRPVSSEARS